METKLKITNLLWHRACMKQIYQRSKCVEDADFLNCLAISVLEISDTRGERRWYFTKNENIIMWFAGNVVVQFVFVRVQI